MEKNRIEPKGDTLVLSEALPSTTADFTAASFFQGTCAEVFAGKTISKEKLPQKHGQHVENGKI